MLHLPAGPGRWRGMWPWVGGYAALPAAGRCFQLRRCSTLERVNTTSTPHLLLLLLLPPPPPCYWPAAEEGGSVSAAKLVWRERQQQRWGWLDRAQPLDEAWLHYALYAAHDRLQ